MLIFGHAHLPHEKLYHIASIEAIKNTPSNTTLLFDYNEEVFELIQHAQENDLDFALNINSVKEAVISENLDAKYLLLSSELAIPVQKAADTYLFDAKILAHIKDENEIEDLATEGIDGVIFAEAIIKVS